MQQEFGTDYEPILACIAGLQLHTRSVGAGGGTRTAIVDREPWCLACLALAPATTMACTSDTAYSPPRNWPVIPRVLNDWKIMLSNELGMYYHPMRSSQHFSSTYTLNLARTRVLIRQLNFSSPTTGTWLPQQASTDDPMPAPMCHAATAYSLTVFEVRGSEMIQGS